MSDVRRRLESVSAPPDVVSWAAQQSDLPRALGTLDRPDWLVWLARAGIIAVDDLTVLRAARLVASLGNMDQAAWRSHLFRPRPDVFDLVSFQCDSERAWDDLDHKFADFINGIVSGFLLFVPLDLRLWFHPLPGLAGLRREIITLPALVVLMAVTALIWRALRLRAAARARRHLSFSETFARLGPLLSPAVERADRSVRSTQLNEVRRSFGLTARA